MKVCLRRSKPRCHLPLRLFTNIANMIPSLPDLYPVNEAPTSNLIISLRDSFLGILSRSGIEELRLQAIGHGHGCFDGSKDLPVDIQFLSKLVLDRSLVISGFQIDGHWSLNSTPIPSG